MGRINEEIQREMANLLRTVKDPRVSESMVSVIRVDTASDLSVAKIFVSALTPMSIDNYTRIHTTDMRLLRRMVRDHKFRNHSALDTIKSWPSVREGEEKYIFPCQEEADIFFNTSLIYEPAVLRKYAEPLLQAIEPKDAGAYFVASRLFVLLSLIEPMEETAIPNNSIMKEFIGGSTFADAL